LPGRSFLLRVVHSEINRGWTQAVAHSLDKIHNIKRDTAVYHGLIVILFPYLILLHVFFRLAVIHLVDIAGRQAATLPQVFSRAANFRAKVIDRH